MMSCVTALLLLLRLLFSSHSLRTASHEGVMILRWRRPGRKRARCEDGSDDDYQMQEKLGAMFEKIIPDDYCSM